MEEIRPNKILDLFMHMQQLIAPVSFALFVEPSNDTSCGLFLFFPSLYWNSQRLQYCVDVNGSTRITSLT